MAYRRSSFVDYTIIGLLLANLGLTAYLVLGSRSNGTEASDSSKAEIAVSETQADSVARSVLDLYNANDSAGLYRKFDPLAKAQLTEKELTGQLDTLYPLMGKISDVAFSNAVLAGNEDGRDYFHLNYKVRLDGGAFASGDMRITVTPRGDDFGIVGFFINGNTR